MRFRPVRLRVDDDRLFELICVLIIEVLVWKVADQFDKITCMNVGCVSVCVRYLIMFFIVCFDVCLLA